MEQQNIFQFAQLRQAHSKRVGRFHVLIKVGGNTDGEFLWPRADIAGTFHLRLYNEKSLLNDCRSCPIRANCPTASYRAWRIARRQWISHSRHTIQICSLLVSAYVHCCCSLIHSAALENGTVNLWRIPEEGVSCIIGEPEKSINGWLDVIRLHLLCIL